MPYEEPRLCQALVSLDDLSLCRLAQSLAFRKAVALRRNASAFPVKLYESIFDIAYHSMRGLGEGGSPVSGEWYTF